MEESVLPDPHLSIIWLKLGRLQDLLDDPRIRLG